MRNAFLVFVSLCVGFLAGALSYRAYVFHRYFREMPEEAPARPIVQGPDEVAQEAAAVMPVRADLAARSDGVVIWEGEWVNRLTGTFECLSASDASRDAALWVREGTGRNNPGQFHPPRHPYVDMGVADWFVDLPRGGRYRLYMRIWALDQCGNSCWVGFDTTTNLHYFPGGSEGTYGAKHYHWPDAMYRRWLWIEDEGYVYDLSAGPHRLHVEVREDGFAIDQIALVPLDAPAPAGILQPCLMPGRGRLPEGVTLSSAAASTRATGFTTPFDCYLALNHHLLTGEASPQTTGWAWLRLNASDALDVEVSLDASGLAVSPAASLRCRLTPDAPLAKIPLVLSASPDVPRRAFQMRLSGTSSAVDGLEVIRTVRFARPLEWWVLGPLGAAQDAAVGEALRDAKTVDVTRSPVASLPSLAWTRALAPDHYDDFGAVDFNKMFGPHDRGVAYVVTRIRVEKSGAYRLLAAGDDTLRLRLAGTLLVDDSRRAPVTDTLRPHPVHLEAGDHFLIGRVEQSGRWWQMFVQFGGADGAPAEAVRGLSLRE